MLFEAFILLGKRRNKKKSMKKCEYVKITKRKKGIVNWFDSINVDCLFSTLYNVLYSVQYSVQGTVQCTG